MESPTYFLQEQISLLQKQVLRLQEELEQAHKDIIDFEFAAKQWKSGYSDMEREYRIKLGNAEQTIKQLEQELEEANS